MAVSSVRLVSCAVLVLCFVATSWAQYGAGYGGYNGGYGGYNGGYNGYYTPYPYGNRYNQNGYYGGGGYNRPGFGGGIYVGFG